MLRRAFSDTQLVALLEGIGPKELVTLSQSFPADLVVARLAASSDSGAALLAAGKNVAKKDDVVALTAGPPALTAEVLVSLLGQMSSTTLLTLLPLAGSPEVLLRLRAAAVDDSELESNLRDLRAAGWKPDQALVAAQDADAGVFTQDLADQKVAMGLVAENGTAIAWMSSTKIVGDGEANEQQAVTAALAELDAGRIHVPGVCENRGDHENWAGDLPGARNVVPYREQGIQPPTAHWPGRRRLVVDESVAEPAKRRVYYTWTHYGQHGAPAFVRIR